MGIPNPIHQALSNVFASHAVYAAVFTAPAGTTGANEASGGGYARQPLGTPTPDGVGDNNWAQVNVPVAAGTYEEGGFFSTSTGTTVSAPSGVAVTAATGGTLTSGTTYYYKLGATNVNGTTTPSSEVSITPSGSNLSATLTWSTLAGVSDQSTLAKNFAGFPLWRGTTAGGENVLVTTVSPSVLTYTDTGAAGTSATPPSSNTASTFIGSNSFTGGYVVVTGTGASINVAASVTS